MIARYIYIKRLLAREGIRVLAYTSDGDTRFLKAQKMLQNFGGDYEFCGIPLSAALHSEITSTQDSLHLLKKLKSSLYDGVDLLKLGNYIATLGHLVIVFKSFDKYQHNLRVSDIDSSDHMNYSSLEKILDSPIIDLLGKVKYAEGTIVYLEMMQGIRKAYVLQNTSVKEKLYCATWTLHFLRIWKAWLLENDISVKHFITTNSFECIEMNYVFFLKLVLSNNAKNMPFLNSQVVEGFFRKLRSFTGVEDLVVGTSMKGVLTRIQKIQIEEKLSHELQEKYEFPRTTKKFTGNDPLNETLTNEELIGILNMAREFAKTQADKLGMKPKEVVLSRLISKVQNNYDFCVDDIEIESRLDILNVCEEQINLNNIDNEKEYDDDVVDSSDLILQNIHFKGGETSTKSTLFANYKGKQIIISKNRLCCLLQNNRIKVSGDVNRRFIKKRDLLFRKPSENLLFWDEVYVGRGDYVIVHQDSKVIMGRIINLQYPNNKNKGDRIFRGDFVEINSSAASKLHILLSPSYYIDREGHITELKNLKFYKVENYICHTNGQEEHLNQNYVEKFQEFILN